MGELSSLKLLQAAGVSTVALAAVVLVGIAVITGFKQSGQVVNATADLFVTRAYSLRYIYGGYRIGTYRKSNSWLLY